MNLEIKIKQGLGDIKFDMPIEEVVAILGQADEVEEEDNAADEPTTILRYEENGITLFFEGENPVLASIDISNEESKMMGCDIFDLEEKEIIDMMKKNNYTDYETEDEDWGERRLTFNEGNIDFYLEDDMLMSVLISK